MECYRDLVLERSEPDLSDVILNLARLGRQERNVDLDAAPTEEELAKLRGNINLFYPPADVVAGSAPVGQPIRVGGLAFILDYDSVVADQSGEVSLLIGCHWRGPILTSVPLSLHIALRLFPGDQCLPFLQLFHLAVHFFPLSL